MLTASYPIGTLVGSIPGGVLAARAGPKLTVCAGLALLAVSTLAFGFLHSAPALDVARFVEGWAVRARGPGGWPGSWSTRRRSGAAG